jgi:hypothetical protein
MRYDKQRNKRKKWINLSIWGVVIIGLFIAVYWLVGRFKDPDLPAVKAVPANSVAVLKINSTLEFWNHLQDSNHIWQEIQCLQYFRALQLRMKKIDSVVNENNDIKKYVTENPAYVAWVPYRESINVMFTLNLKGAHEEKKVTKFIEKQLPQGHSIITTSFLDIPVYSVFKGTTLSFSYAVYKGIFIAGENLGMVESGISAVIGGVYFENSEKFSAINSLAGKKVDANLFFDFTFLNNFFQPFVQNKFNKELKFLSYMAKVGMLDLTLKKNELLLNGYAISDENSQWFNKVFKFQKPREISITGKCPDNTALMLCWGLSNTGDYLKNNAEFFQNNFHRNSWQQTCGKIDNTFGEKFSESFIKSLSDEFALIITYNPGVENTYEKLGIFKVNDPAEMQSVLSPSSEHYSEIVSDKNDTVPIYRIKFKGLFSSFFGNIFQSLDSAYYLFLDNYLVCGFTANALELYSTSVFSGRTLDKNENFKKFSDNVSEEANLWFYANIRKSLPYIENLVDPSHKQLVVTSAKQLRNFQAIAFQMLSEKSKFYLNGYINHNSKYIDENPAVWAYKAESVVSGQATIVYNPLIKEHQVVFFDRQKTLYMLNRNGNQSLKILVPELPVGHVHLVGNERSGKASLLFNSGNNVYIIDIRKSKPVVISIELPYAATAGLSVVVTSQKKTKIIVPCLNQKIYAYTLEAKQDKSWKIPQQSAVVNQPIEYFKIKNKELFVVSDKNGKVTFYDVNGREWFGKHPPFIKARHSNFYIHNDGSKQYLVCSDRSGKLIFISPDGTMDVVKLQEFTANHYFLHADYNGDKQDDFIFIDMGVIHVYNHLKKEIIKVPLPVVPGGDLRGLLSSNGNFTLVFPDKSNRHLALIKPDGSIDTTSFSTGSSLIETGKLYNENTTSILVSDTTMLMHYLLK